MTSLDASLKVGDKLADQLECLRRGGMDSRDSIALLQVDPQGITEPILVTLCRDACCSFLLDRPLCGLEKLHAFV